MTGGKPNAGRLRIYWEQFVLCVRCRPVLTAATLGVQLTGTVSFVAIGLALREVMNASHAGLASAAVVGAVGAAAAYAADFVVGVIGRNLRITVVEQVGMLETDAEIFRDVCGIETIDHLEQAEYADRISELRGAAWAVTDSSWAVIETLLNALKLLVSLLLLSQVSWYLLLLLGGALVPLWFDALGKRAVVRAQAATAGKLRLQRRYFELAVKPSTGKEIRATGAGPELARRQLEAWTAAHAERLRAQVRAAVWTGAGWFAFVSCFAAALALVCARAAGRPGGVGDVVFTITVAANLRAAVRSTVSRATELAGHGRLVEPLVWLRDRSQTARRYSRGTEAAPARLRHGIAIRELSYRYPGTERRAVDGVTAYLPAGSVVAIVGEYGSGKSTLVKLLCGFHAPSGGDVLVDGVALRDLDGRDWRGRIACAFQDFGRYPATFREAVGLGDPARITDDARIREVLAAAGAERLLAALPDGLDTRLGAEYGGMDLSEGQWQKTALARASMREHPLLFLLDEPTASLDAAAEQAVFERFMARAREIARRSGAITLIVSHRFSTVAGADLILVMQAGALIEQGSHAYLLEADGTYAELYKMASDAYTAGPSSIKG